MYCDSCGSRNDFDAIFCKKCGFNFNKNNQKLNNKKKIKAVFDKLNNKKEQIISILLIVFLTIIIILKIYNSSDVVKYRKYLEKNNFNCQKNVCQLKEDEYDVEIELTEKRILYKKTKINEMILFTYAGEDLGSFNIKDSLSEFTCGYIDGQINTDSCMTSLKKAGVDTYTKKMNDIVSEVKKLVSETKIDF